MYLINSNLAFIKSVGAISESSMSELRGRLIEFPIMESPSQSVRIFRGARGLLVVQPNQIIVARSSIEGDLDLSDDLSTLTSVNTFLKLTEQVLVVLSVEGLVPANGSGKQKTLRSFVDAAQRLRATGIGYRFMVEDEDVNGDVRIEPYLVDDSNIYYQVQLQTKANVDITCLVSIIEKMRKWVADAEAEAKSMIELG